MTENSIIVLTREQLNAILTENNKKIFTQIKDFIRELQMSHNVAEQRQEKQSETMTIADVVEYTGFSKAYIYSLTSKREIPYYKTGHRLFFKRSEVDRYIFGNRCKSNDEIEKQATTYCVTHKARK